HRLFAVAGARIEPHGRIDGTGFDSGGDVRKETRMVKPRETKILIAEDDDASRRLLEKYLTMKGFQVTTAGDGSECCRRFFAEDPDLVLLDINMPELDGWAILKEIQSTRPVPVIML